LKGFQYLIKPFSENAEQQSVVNYLKTVYPNVLFTTGLLGIHLPEWAMWLLVTLGYKAGTPDILIFEPRGMHHGLMMEMKRPRSEYMENGKKKIKYQGKLSDEQKAVLNELQKRGYYIAVCYCYDEAKRVIDEYLVKDGNR
jgi:hypothetical protein